MIKTLKRMSYGWGVVLLVIEGQRFPDEAIEHPHLYFFLVLGFIHLWWGSTRTPSRCGCKN